MSRPELRGPEGGERLGHAGSMFTSAEPRHGLRHGPTGSYRHRGFALEGCCSEEQSEGPGRLVFSADSSPSATLLIKTCENSVATPCPFMVGLGQLCVNLRMVIMPFLLFSTCSLSFASLPHPGAWNFRISDQKDCTKSLKPLPHRPNAAYSM